MASVRRGLVVAVLYMVVVAALAASVGRPAASPGPRLSPFAGPGSWISVYDTRALRHPRLVVATLRAHRIHTLFLETSNARRPRAVAHPVATARLLDAAHRAGIAVVGWYVPSFAAPARDVRRALAGARFHSPAGVGFDAFALDIEATTVRSLPRRSARAVVVARSVRAALPPGLALGAITIDPFGGRYWNHYPFRQLAESVDVFLPMEYFTYRTTGVRGVAAYSRANVRLVRKLAGAPAFPVHPIGGDARRATLRELRAFFRASAESHVVGVSLWEYGGTSGRQWAALATATDL
jgi:hypothetical protein